MRCFEDVLYEMSVCFVLINLSFIAENKFADFDCWTGCCCFCLLVVFFLGGGGGLGRWTRQWA